MCRNTVNHTVNLITIKNNDTITKLQKKKKENKQMHLKLINGENLLQRDITFTKHIFQNTTFFFLLIQFFNKLSRLFFVANEIPTHSIL